jgi:hypothetical protein
LEPDVVIGAEVEPQAGRYRVRMAEKDMVKAVNAALGTHGIDDTVEVAGQFQPRGTSGSMFAGGLIGGEVGGAFGDVGQAIGVGAGALGGIEASKRAGAMPFQMLVGASPTHVYGFKMHGLDGRRSEPRDLVFQVPREGLDVNVHGRVNVRTLELTDRDTGSRIELEGNRMPITHSHDLITYVAGQHAVDTADEQAKLEQGPK